MSWRPEVRTDQGGTWHHKKRRNGRWYHNRLRFLTYDEAMRNARDVAKRWSAVVECRAKECRNQPANSVYTDAGTIKWIKRRT
jgi:hypothetical protein